MMLMMVGFAYPQISFAADEEDIFKSSEFLTWERNSQEFYIDTTIGMAGLIASQNDQAKGQCIDEWYFQRQSDATDFILDVMRDYPNYHPRGTIAAIIEKQCGSLTFN